jgi:hypothetical protein
MAIEISATDLANAEEFIATLLTENVENGLFTEGTALRDLVVKAFSFIFAHISKENDEVRALQSLLNVQDIAEGDPDTDRSVSDSIDAIMSNWFITRKVGSFSRGVLTIEVNRRQDYIIPGNNRFLYDRSRAFFPDVVDTSASVIIRAGDLIPVTDTTGAITRYRFELRVIAARTGTAYDVNPATWSGGRQFSVFVTRIFNSIKFSGGLGREGTTEIVERANTAIAVRNLINPRSIDATLLERFSDIRRLFVIGMGDPEMQRDLNTGVAPGIEIHLGGHFDVYLELPRTEVTFEGQLGGVFTRPDGIPNVFRDATVPSWTAEAIQVGDNIRISAGLADVPRDYIIKEILPTELRVSEITPFPEATELAGTFVDYFIFRPVFGPDIQIFPTVGVNTTGETFDTIQTDNRVVLPGGPHYDILDVAVIDPDPGDVAIDAGDGFVHFPVRSNTTPVVTGVPEEFEYQIINNDPSTAQSQLQFEEIVVESTYNAKTLRVRYETLVGMDTIHDFTRDRFQRILAANILARGFFPVYLACTVPYRLSRRATAVVDEAALRNEIVSFINNFDPRDTIDVSDITQVVRNFDTNIGTIFNFPIEYRLIAPDGRVIPYSTEDIVDLDPAKIVVTTPPTTLDAPLTQSLSDATVRYMTSLASIIVAVDA